MTSDVTNDTGARIGELVRQRQADLSPAERKLARVLLASYPIAGLESVARFAERAGVSAPTVTRFITKLGFRGYPEFQEQLRQEVQARLSSPLARYHEEEPKGASSLVSGALERSRRTARWNALGATCRRRCSCSPTTTSRRWSICWQTCAAECWSSADG